MASRCAFQDRTIPPFDIGDIGGFLGKLLKAPKLGRPRFTRSFNADLTLPIRGIGDFELGDLLDIGDFGLPKAPPFGIPRKTFTFNANLTLKRPVLPEPSLGDLLGFLPSGWKRPPISLPPCFLDA